MEGVIFIKNKSYGMKIKWVQKIFKGNIKIYKLLDELEGYIKLDNIESVQVDMEKVINVLSGKLRRYLDT